jgi:ApaG protein
MPVAVASENVTEGIRVKAEPLYLPEQSEPEQNQFVFTYKITIRNESDS